MLAKFKKSLRIGQIFNFKRYNPVRRRPGITCWPSSAASQPRFLSWASKLLHSRSLPSRQEISLQTVLFLLSEEVVLSHITLKVPQRHSVFTPGGVLHSNNYLRLFAHFKYSNKKRANMDWSQGNLEDNVIRSGSPGGQAGKGGKTVFIQNQIDPIFLGGVDMFSCENWTFSKGLSWPERPGSDLLKEWRWSDYCFCRREIAPLVLARIFVRHRARAGLLTHI